MSQGKIVKHTWHSLYVASLLSLAIGCQSQQQTTSQAPSYAPEQSHTMAHEARQEEPVSPVTAEQPYVLVEPEEHAASVPTEENSAAHPATEASDNIPLELEDNQSLLETRQVWISPDVGLSTPVPGLSSFTK